MKYIFYIMVLFFCCCQQNDDKKQPCVVDSKFTARYDYYYNYMVDNFKENRTVDGYMIRSIGFMKKLTGIESQVIYGDVTIFEKYEDFEEDMNKWKNWYSENKCNVTGSFIDSLENELLNSTSWVDGPTAVTRSSE